MLIRTIEENKLYEYDRMVMGSRISARKSELDTSNSEPRTSNYSVSVRSPKSRIKERNRIQYVIVEEGDSYESLADDFDLLSWEIFRYNDLPDDANLVKGQLVYLQPKRNKAEAGSEFHIMKEGETMYTISQLYGIKLKILYEMNHLVPGRNPGVGTELWLRRTKPEGL